MKSASVGLSAAFLIGITGCKAAGATALQVEALRETLLEAEAGRLPPGSAILETPLAGYVFHQELRQTSGARVFVVGARTGGGILAFRPDGSRLNGIETGEVLSFLAAVIDRPDVALLAREVDGAGTGYREENHHLYRMTSSGIEDVWEGTAYLLEIGPEQNGKRERMERRGSSISTREVSGVDHV